KKGGGIHLCVDLREPNKAIVIDSHPLPHKEEVFAELRGAKMFSTLDLQSAYYQVMLHEDSRYLTAFITHEGLFYFKRVPYGLTSSPSAFQKMMSLILKNQHGVQCYLDDIIVFGNTSEEHDNNLQSVLNCISKGGLQLNRSKCKFRQTELSFLGHTISQIGLKPDPDHIWQFQILLLQQICKPYVPSWVLPPGTQNSFPIMLLSLNCYKNYYGEVQA
ncbi:unnamed protein product, partial [Natator depressus]